MSTLRGWLLGPVLAASIAACAHERAPVFSPQAIDALAADCRRRIDSGAVERWRRSTHQVGTRGAPFEAIGEDARVVVYGASWCRACDAAAQYLTQRKIPFVEKDVEVDRDADREARDATNAAGLDGHALPVIVVGRTVMLGFYPCVLEDALAAGGSSG